MVPSVFTATQAICPTCDDEALGIIKRPATKVTPVSPDVTLRLFSNHWNIARGLASASHVNVTDEFSGTVKLTGCCVMEGGSAIEKHYIKIYVIKNQLVYTNKRTQAYKSRHSKTQQQTHIHIHVWTHMHT